MIPLFLLVLLPSFLLATPYDCVDPTSCLYITACYNEVAGNSTGKPSTVLVSPLIATAFFQKSGCSGFGFVSRLSILSTSTSSMAVTFETALGGGVGFALGFPENASRLEFETDETPTARLNGIALELEQPTVVTDHLGRKTYSFRVEDPQGLHLHSLLVQPVFFVADESRFPANVPDFHEALKRNLACDARPMYDVCLDSHSDATCDKVRISNHSLSCKRSGQLQYKSIDKWADLASAVCRYGKWAFTTGDGTEAMEPTETTVKVACRKRASSDPSATASPDDLETEEPEDPEIPEADTHKPPGAAQVKESTGAPPSPKKEPDNRLILPGNKWIWIGGFALLLLLLIFANIVVCLYCYRKKDDGNSSKLSKTAKRSKKKMGGKRQSPVCGESSNPPSTSELMGNSAKQPNTPSAKTCKAPGSTHAVKSDFAGGTTEMNLDRLKTERID